MSLLKGMGIEANAEEATYWFQKAAAQAPIVYTKADRSISAAKAVPMLSAVTACHRRTEPLVARPRPLRCRRSSSSLFAFDPTMQSHLSITAAQIRMKGKGLGLPQYATACAIGRKGTRATESTHWLKLTVWSLQSNGLQGHPKAPLYLSMASPADGLQPLDSSCTSAEHSMLACDSALPPSVIEPQVRKAAVGRPPWSEWHSESRLCLNLSKSASVLAIVTSACRVVLSLAVWTRYLRCRRLCCTLRHYFHCLSIQRATYIIKLAHIVRCHAGITSRSRCSIQ